MRLRPDAALRTERNGRVLLGGNPFRVVRLSDGGAVRVRSWFRRDDAPDSPEEQQLARRLVEAGLAHPVPAPTAMALHVVVPFRGVRADLEATLAAVRSCSVASITVVDDGNDTPLPPLPGVDVIRHSHARGPAAARNTGWRRVGRHDTGTGSTAAEANPDHVVVFVDAGVNIPASVARERSNWMDRLSGHLIDPSVAAAAPRVVSPPGSSVIHRYEAMFSPLDLGPDPSIVAPGRAVPYVPTACLAVRLADLVEQEGFDERLRYGEDVDLVWRLAAAGRVVRYDPSTVVHHEPRHSLRAFVEQRYRYASAAAALEQRHGSVVAPWSSSIVGLAGVTFLSLGHPVPGALIGLAPLPLLAKKLGTTATPMATSLRLLARGHTWSIRAFAESVGRSWAPVAIVAALATSRQRVVVSWMVAGWSRRAASTRSATLLGLGVIDDLAYGAGAVAGAIRHRSLRSLVPRISRWG